MSQAEEQSFETPEKLEKFRAQQNCDTWYAACEYMHFFWAGPDRETEEEAIADGRAHDARKHGGSETAVVLC